jgi:diguanylate cyclase (GGDEF)-like protein/PAS domain S-box-containing protein
MMSSSMEHKKASRAGTRSRRDEEVHKPVTWEPSRTFLQASVIAILLSGLLVSAAIYLFIPGSKDAALRTSTVLLVGLAGVAALRRGELSATVKALGIGMWCYVALMVFVGGGITAPVQFVFTLIIFMLGWLVSTKVALLVAGLTSAFTVLTMSASYGAWLPASAGSPLWLHALVQICVFFMAAVLVHFLVRAYQRRLQDLDVTNDRVVQRSHELERAKTELHQAQAQAKVGSWVYRVDADSMQLSDEALRIFGLQPGDTLTRRGFMELLRSEDQRALSVLWGESDDTKDVVEVEHQMRVRGDWYWVLQKARLDRDSAGRLVSISGVVQDVHERKLVELSLRYSENKFATAFQSSPVAASIVTLEHGIFIEANNKYQRDFGWAPSELLGRSTLELGLWPDADLRVQWVSALRARGSVVDHEASWVHHNGQLRKVSMSGEIIDHNGTPCILAFVTDITERKAAESQIHHLAFYDALTGLPNRRYLLGRLERALADAPDRSQFGALLFIDLDNFKALNDTHGHGKGDDLLRQVAARLQAIVQKADTVSRLGGDEFVVLLEALADDPLLAASRAEGVAARILAALDRGYDLGEVHFYNTPSIGVTLFGDRQEAPEQPLQRADTAMYEAKSAGRNTIRFFDPAMQAAVGDRLALETELRSAIGTSELFLLYQPQVNASGQVTGVEALVRWEHARRGLVAPAEFIPIAEASGLILPLGEWILRTACEQLRQWSSHPELQHLEMAVNVSARQFKDPEFVSTALRLVEETGANPVRLKLEMTESMLIDGVDLAISKMQQLKNHGIGFALDDFGTGYSSLAYLKRLPFDQIKIDRSFVRDVLDDPNDAAIARMVVVLAETMGLHVIAEGVETEAQHIRLKELGCKGFQGFHFGRPVSAQAVVSTASTTWMPRTTNA